MAGLARRDVLLGSVALVTEVAEIALHGPGSWALALIGAVAVTAALLVGRRAPLAGGVAFAAGYAALAAGGMSNQATAAVMWVLVSYRVALAADTSVEVGVGALVSVVPIVMFGLANRDQSVDEFAPVDLLLMGGVWVAGRAMRQRQLRLADLEERVKLSEREREALARVAVAEERTRIARELHDVVAHGLSLIVVQAQAANSLLDRAPDRARTAVIAIEDAGRDALVDMRRLLGVLRGEDAPSGLAPQPSLARLDALVVQVGDAGIATDVHIEGDIRPLPAGVDLAAYRIIQEALTNVVKHAHATRARLRLRYAPRHLEIEVTDNGRGAAADTTGHGLIGMRERAALYHGQLEMFIPSDGGFGVHVRLEVDGG